MALLHLGYDVATGRNFPIVDVWNMPKGVEFVPNPKRPLAVTARVADECPPRQRSSGRTTPVGAEMIDAD